MSGGAAMARRAPELKPLPRSVLQTHSLQLLWVWRGGHGLYSGGHCAMSPLHTFYGGGVKR
jgi:hypothetical protein